MLSKKDFIPISIIALFVIVFFARLFYPTSSLFVTPDFGQSDIWQLNFPLKYFLSQSLHHNSLPLWSNLVGNGFPIMAEGQMGTFNLQNLLLFKFLPFVNAFNLSYVLIFLTSALGTYLYLRLISINPPLSLFGAISFAFSGFFVTHVPHLNLIHTASYLPWAFYFLERYLSSTKSKYLLALSLLLSQQILAGFPQITFITLMFLLFYLFLEVFLINKEQKSSSKKLLVTKVILSLILGFGLSSIQLLPQKEFLDISTRSGGFSPGDATYFSFPGKHLITFLNPTALGTPQNGSYPDFIKTDGSMYWENNGFLGFLPFLAGLAAILLICKNTKVRNYLILLTVSFLMMLGKYSPIYLIYSIIPFSYFRVPSRFILVFVWSLTVLSSLILNHLYVRLDRFTNKYRSIIGRGFIYLIMFFSVIQLMTFSFNYNPLQKTSQILNPPETAVFLQKNRTKPWDRFFLIYDHDIWNQAFETKGWTTFAPYLYFRNNLKADFNQLFSLPSSNVYPILLTRRFDLTKKIIDYELSFKDNQIVVSDLALRLLSLENVRFIISPYQIQNNPHLRNVYETKNNYPGFPSYRIYENLLSRPQISFVNHLESVDTVNDFIAILKGDKIDLSNLSFSEKNLSLPKQLSPPRYEIRNLSVFPDELRFSLITDTDGVIVWSDSYYPGWQAYVDQKPHEIVPLNLNSKGLLISKGNHQIVFSYRPSSLKDGGLLSLISLLIFLTLVGLEVFHHVFGH